MSIKEYGPWNFNDLFDIKYKNEKSVSRPLSFLNIQIRIKKIDNNSTANKKVNLHKSNLKGSGIYSIYFEEKLIYIGSYFPKKGDIRSQRWIHHLGTATMRGYRVHIQEKTWGDIRKTGEVCDKPCVLEFLEEFKKGLIIKDQEKLKKRREELYKIGQRRNRTAEEKKEYKCLNKKSMSVIGNAPDASKRRIHFANKFWQYFRPKPDETIESIKNIFSKFDFYYIRDTESPINVDAIYRNNNSYRKHIIKKVEKVSVNKYNPIINDKAKLQKKLDANSNKVQKDIFEFYEEAIRS